MKRRQFLHRSVALAALLSSSSCFQPVSVPTPTIRIRSGKLRGEIVDGIHRFLGIPYAEVPFGLNRWKPPIPRRPWQGTLAATQYGAICPQTGSSLDFNFFTLQ